MADSPPPPTFPRTSSSGPMRPDRRGRRRSRLVLLVAVGLAGLVVRSTWHEVRRGEPNEASLDALFAPFANVAGGAGPVGVLLEPGHPAEVRGLVNKLRYALAPVDVSEGDAGQRFVAVWASTEEGRARQVDGRRLREVARTSDGYVLYERAGP